MTDKRKKLVNVYIDGFNFYHRIKKYHEVKRICYKWLNYRSLAESFLRDGQAQRGELLQKCDEACEVFRKNELPSVQVSLVRYNAGDMICLQGFVPFSQFQTYQRAKREAESGISLILETNIVTIDLKSERHILKYPRLIACY